MVIGIIVGLANSDSRFRDSQPLAFAFIGATNGAVLGAIIGFIIDQIRKSPAVKSASNKIEQIKEDRKLNESVKSSMKIYQEAVHNFQYLSDQTLWAKFNSESVENLDNMERLALEEEMVKRGLIEFSPMHEKLDKLKNMFK